MRGKEVLSAIKNDIEGHIGEKVLLKANSGRRKVVVKEGILEKTYPNIFVVRVEGNDNSSRTISYSYSDILTKTVQLVYKKGNVAIG
ncbi:Veg protein [Fervidicella metallireducens AeB]|uniref:Veg protein n=1 Tax=Fervidicella metallireducens AeB TaxID=1403537 RepID=A0A017RYM9_9CLOT|nr:Veg family protein [Fervidicella metallireducens]EYE89782.1 Veg protein [Fervidicella metallireducens AeB]